MRWARGDSVIVSHHGVEVVGRVLLVSSNRRSIAITYSGTLAGCAEMMPLLLLDDGTWQCVPTGAAIGLRDALG